MALWGTADNRALKRRRVHERRRRRRIVFTTLLLVLLALVLAGVWYGTRMASVTLSTVSVSGVQTLSEAEIVRRVEGVLDGSYVLLIPRRFSFLYPHDALVAELRAVPKIADVSVTRASHTGLVVSVHEHLPYALWCAEEQHMCVFVSSDGTAFAPAPPLHGAVLLRYVKEGVQPEVGAELAEARYLTGTREFSRALAQEHGMYVERVRETAMGDVEYRLRGGGELLVSRDASIQSVFENLDSILADSAFAHLTPYNFEYIDLRFGNEVFVKERAPAVATEDVDETAAATLGTDDE